MNGTCLYLCFPLVLLNFWISFWLLFFEGHLTIENAFRWTKWCSPNKFHCKTFVISLSSTTNVWMDLRIGSTFTYKLHIIRGKRPPKIFKNLLSELMYQISCNYLMHSVKLHRVCIFYLCTTHRNYQNSNFPSKNYTFKPEIFLSFFC